MLSYKQRLNQISTFIFDVDGVFTDGKVYLINDEIVRALNSKDGYAVQYAVKMGYKIFCITGAKLRRLFFGYTPLMRGSTSVSIWRP